MTLKILVLKIKSLIETFQKFMDELLSILPIFLIKTKRPRGVLHSVKCWADKTRNLNKNRQGIYTEIHPSLPITRKKPKTLETEVNRQFLLDYGNKSEPAFVANVPKGRFWNNSAVISSNNKLLGDVSLFFKVDPRETPTQHPVFWKEVSSPEYIKGRVAVLAAPGGNTYFHWIIDVLPRISLLKRSSIPFSSIDYFIVNSFDLLFQQQTLSLLNVPQEKLISSDRHKHIIADQLIVPSFPRHKTCNIGRWVFDFLRQELMGQVLNSQEIVQNKRLYISRARANRRKVVNEPEVMACLEKYGFQAVYLEELSIFEQVTLFAEAEWVVGPHGAGFTNLVFCSPGTKVVEIYSPNYISVSYWNISCQIGLDYYYLFGKDEGLTVPQNVNHLAEDISIDTQLLEKILNLV